MLPENLCSLTTLKISKCPELILESPTQLPTLKRFLVIGSPKLEILLDHAGSFTRLLQGMTKIVHFKIVDCHSLTTLPISNLPSTLKRIWIYSCGKLKLESSVSGEMISSGCNMFLDALTLDGCDSIEDVSTELVPKTRSLTIDGCRHLTRLLIPAGTEFLDIHNCNNLEMLSVACGTRMTSLHHLYITNCQKLKSLPECMQELLPSLKMLSLQDCPEIPSFPEGGFPFSLEVLEIDNCKKLVNGRKEWHLERLPCLTDLSITHDGSDKEILADKNWELPCSILSLRISNLKTLSSQVLKSLTSLEYLYTENLPQVWSLLEEGLPSSLYALILNGNDELQSLPTEGLRPLTSLRSLSIFSYLQLQSLPLLPSSLSELIISSCPNLQSLPVKEMPSSISKLCIFNCPLLKPCLEFEKGKCWPEIAQISTIDVGLECM